MSSPSTSAIPSSFSGSSSAKNEETITPGSTASSSSCYYDIRPTPYGGRGAFASRSIPKGTVILNCEGPYASVLLKKFRKEVCAWCFAWVFESTKGKKGTWSTRLESSMTGNGGSSAWTPWFCGESCREDWIQAYSSEIDGVSDHGGALVGLMTSLDKTLLSYRSTKTRAKGKQKTPSSPANGNSTASSSSAHHLFAFLDTWKTEDVSAESVDRCWKSAEITFTPPSLGKRTMILDFLESWNDASSEDFTELLTEFEVDCARFVLDGLVRLVLQQTNTRGPDRTSDGTFSHADMHSTLASQSGALENVKPTGYWSDLLHLQNNELEHVKSKPYMLGVFIRVYAFLRFVALSTLSATNSTKRSRGRKGHGMANDTVEAAPPKQDAFLETLVKLLETSEGVRAILARDHGNVFGIWEKGSPSDSNGEDDSSDSEMLGWGMYVFGSYFNHDCTPTVRKTQHSRSLCFTSTRDIAPGEELCINYIDVSKSNGVMKRNEELSKEWFFECGCARCERERKELA